MAWNALFLKQIMMRRVLFSLFPLLLFSVFLFGWRVLLLLVVVTLAAVLTEYFVFQRWYEGKQKVSEAVLVSSALFTLTLPPATPLWVGVVGIVFGVFFGKAIFGGFGKNVFNPALLGRCFVYISFPAYMTNLWTEPFSQLPGGLANYAGVDAISMATPMAWSEAPSFLQAFFGTIPGSMGETSAVLILAAAVYLVFTKTASWQIMVSSAAGFLGLSTILYFSGSLMIQPLLFMVVGGFLFGTVFMATDPISAPRQGASRLIYGFIIGMLTVVVRLFGVFPEGVMFAILIANTFAPLLDKKVKEQLDRRKAARQVETGKVLVS